MRETTRELHEEGMRLAALEERVTKLARLIPPADPEERDAKHYWRHFHTDKDRRQFARLIKGLERRVRELERGAENTVESSRTD